MEVQHTPQSPVLAPAQAVAQAYGTNTYSGNTYNGDLTTSTSPQAPSTGFFAEPPIVTIPLLMIAAILVGITSFLIARAIRRSRRK
jgi:predicted S18 family serine protease